MTVRRRIAALAGTALIALAFFATASVSLGGTKITLCHAKPPATAANGWNDQEISPDSAEDPVKGHDGHAADIIPAFDFGGGVEFDGQNLATDFGGFTGQQILDNGCHKPGTTEPPDDTPEPTQEVDATETPTDASGIAGSGPDSAWLLVAAFGALLASVVVLTPARVKVRR